MLAKTRGIVLHSVRYSETSLVVRIYTETTGLQSFLIKGVRSARGTFRAAQFQSLSLLELVIYHKEKPGLQSIREARVVHPLHTLAGDIRKQSIGIFLAELLYRSIREEEANPQLFEFLWHALQLLDSLEGNCAAFPLVFSLHLSRYLGFYPQDNYSGQHRFFHLREGNFQTLFQSTAESLDESGSFQLHRLLGIRLEEVHLATIPAPVRNDLLEDILRFYRLHLPGMPELNSHHVLHTVLA